MPNPSLQPPDQPVALRRSHLLSPSPDRLTNAPTTLRVIRENTLSGRDFSIHQLRSDEEVTSPRRSTLLYTVFGRLWSNSQHREIRDPNGRPLLELRRIWWRGQWTVKRPGGVGDDLLSAELRWGIGIKIAVRFENALASGRWDADELVNMNMNMNRRLDAYRSPHPRRHTLSSSRRNPPFRRRQEPEPDAPPPYTPPPYSAVLAEDHARGVRRGEANGQGHGNGGSEGSGSGAESEESLDEDDKVRADRQQAPLPSYESVRRFSSTSLRDLLDAIEPPGEPAPASTASFPPPRPRSEGGIVDTVNAMVDLKVVQLNSTEAIVTMGEKRIIYVRKERVLDSHIFGSMPRWEVEVAEGVDLLLAVSIVLIIAEFVKHEYRIRAN
ncbi:hypothetical protein N7468_010500 [Penicillium chermesinum]|uniref:Uncharacterized protein n=1 Tax=Penicillium chermesinum TaxID=63820 RepID=A0A9W9T9Y9_9EURO|nr:uncharacterized protein N7468_010500 [Penicillium chermesinum]KAJ5214821.1 hypothetical protein N7468_010500 [Penicillium chermesinum]